MVLNRSDKCEWYLLKNVVDVKNEVKAVCLSLKGVFFLAFEAVDVFWQKNY